MMIGYRCYERRDWVVVFYSLLVKSYLLSVPLSQLKFLLHHHHLLYLQFTKLERLMRYVLIYN